MKLITTHTILGLRLMGHLTTVTPQRQTNTAEIALRCRASRHHAAKVIGRLSQLGYVKTRRGSNGGVSLNREPKSIHLGDLMSDLERRRTLKQCRAACQFLSIDHRLERLFSCGITAFFSQVTYSHH